MVRISLIVLIVALWPWGCHHQKVEPVPGATTIQVSDVKIRAADGEILRGNYGELIETLGVRKGSRILPARPYNPYRIAEDRRRIAAHLQLIGYFDGSVGEPALVFNEQRTRVAITWTVREGPNYRINSVSIMHAPTSHQSKLRAIADFTTGDQVDLARYRPLRRTMAEYLQSVGYGHARVYSRVFVDRTAKQLAFYYYVDAGPKTRVGRINIEGNKAVPTHAIRQRLSFQVGDAYSTTLGKQAQLALLDTGSFTSVSIVSNADILRGPPEYPNTGGTIARKQVDDAGNLVPRKLDRAVDIRVHVVEAPRRQARLEIGVEGDPTRIDTYTGSRFRWRNVIGAQRHITLEGRVGHGWGIDDEARTGFYGESAVRFDRPGWLHPKLDLQLVGRYRDRPFGSALLREWRLGPGLRTRLAPGAFIEVAGHYRHERILDLPSLILPDNLSLPSRTTSKGAELTSRIVLDRRNDGLEPTQGYLLALETAYQPGGALSTHRSLQVLPEARTLLPLMRSWSLALRASAGWVLLSSDAGVAFGSRLFGGGAHGLRGFGRDKLAPRVCTSPTERCDSVAVGGLSLMETTVEARYLPFRKLYGMAIFADLGGASHSLNPLEPGLSAAVGVGLRVRTWYVPVSLDVAYSLLRHGERIAPDSLSSFLAFFRIGEAF